MKATWTKTESGSSSSSSRSSSSSSSNGSQWSVVVGLCNSWDMWLMCRSPIKCGSVIRLTHLNTNKNLHSHHFQSPLSHNLEVSAFGDSGEGDEGMKHVLTCV